MHATDEHWLPGESVIDLSNRMQVEYGTGVGESFGALADPQQDDISANFLENFSIETLSTHWGDLEAWKRDGHVDKMGREESLFSYILADAGPQQDPRNLKIRGTTASKEWGGEACRFAWVLYGLSQSIALTAVSDDCEVADESVCLFRGFHERYDIPHVLAAAVDDPSRKSFTVPATVLNNYSPNETNAAEYSPLVIQKEVHMTDIILTPDYFIKEFDSNDGTLFTNDGECRVLGTVTTNFSANEISVVHKDGAGGVIQNRSSLEEFFDPIPRSNNWGFEVFTKMLESAGERIKEYSVDDSFPREQLLVTTQEGIERLEAWYADTETELQSRTDPSVADALSLITDRQINLE